MNTARYCPQCGTALFSQGNPAVCPRCAFQVALLQPSSPALSGDGFNAATRFVPPTPEQLAPLFSQLEILELVGQGGMGAVYKARQRGLDRLVAVKILPPEVAGDPAFAERFGREARALAKLNHPNIVAVFDSGQTNGMYYFVMEFVDGVNLRQAIQTGKLAPKEALSIVPQLCDALQYAHDQGVVHRDIKPENVLVDRQGKVKIADFGLARLLGSPADSFSLTGSHQVLGTPRYMAPEQLEGRGTIDHRADIYSLGVVFYEMLTGELPLGRFSPPSQKVQVDVRLDEVVLRILEKEPQLRYQQASEIKSAVESILSGPGGNWSCSRAFHPRYAGHEYRSRLTLFGWPLVHIASGIDPATGRKRVAKGIIAIGDVAIGGLAIGGSAVGIVAIGGVACGGITLGGLSLGLLAAAGGGAISLGVAVGGMAIGTLACGGLAIGIYSIGGGTFGLHRLGGNANTPKEIFWRQFVQGVGSWGSLLLLLPLAVPVLLALAALRRQLLSVFHGSTDSRLDQSNPEAPLPDTSQYTATSPPQKQLNVEVFAIGCFLVLLLGMLGVGLVGTYLWMAARSNAAAAMRERAEAERAVLETLRATAEQRSQRLDQQSLRDGLVTPQYLDWNAEGPRASTLLVEDIQLSAKNRDALDAILRSIHSEYLRVESDQIRRESQNGKQIISVQLPAKAITELKEKFWQEVTPLLDERQREILRVRLPLTPQPVEQVGSTDEELSLLANCLPGVLGWGEHATRLTIERTGKNYRTTIETQGKQLPFTETGLDPRWRRFWKEPAIADRPALDQ